MAETMGRVAGTQNAKSEEKLRKAIIKLFHEYGEDVVRNIVAQMSSIPDSGDFVWCIYSIEEENFQGLGDADVVRLMYLSTMITLDGSIASKKKISKNRTGMQSLLGISRRQASLFYSAVLDGKYMKEIGNNLIINRDVFAKGVIGLERLERLAMHGKYATRMYLPAIRSLYESPESNTRRALKYLHKILPVLNREYNIICHNPIETDINKVEPMRIGEFCEAIGYDKSNSGRISRSLFDAKFPVGDHYENVMMRSSNMHPHRDDAYICLNPRIFYAGSKENAELMLTAFHA